MSSKIEAPDVEELFEKYYGEQLTPREIGDEYGVSHTTVYTWFEELELEQFPKSIRYLIYHGPTPVDDYPYDPYGTNELVRFNLTHNSQNRYLARILHLPTHTPEEIVREVLETCAEELSYYPQKTRAYIFGTHGKQYREAYNTVRDEFGL